MKTIKLENDKELEISENEYKKLCIKYDKKYRKNNKKGKLIPFEICEYDNFSLNLRNVYGDNDLHIYYDCDYNILLSDYKKKWNDNLTCNLVDCNVEDIKSGDIIRFTNDDFKYGDMLKDLGLVYVYRIVNKSIYYKSNNEHYKEFDCGVLHIIDDLKYQKVVPKDVMCRIIIH